MSSSIELTITAFGKSCWAAAFFSSDLAHIAVT